MEYLLSQKSLLVLLISVGLEIESTDTIQNVEVKIQDRVGLPDYRDLISAKNNLEDERTFLLIAVKTVIDETIALEIDEFIQLKMLKLIPKSKMQNVSIRFVDRWIDFARKQQEDERT